MKKLISRNKWINRLSKVTLSTLLLLSGSYAHAQCDLDVTLSATTVPCGDSVTMTALAYAAAPVLSTNFNNGTAGAGWQNTGTAQFSQPCGPGINNTPYYWASTSSGSNPSIATNGFDVSCGGQISFDMAYAVQSGGAPCEGPDEQDEGVSLQYSTDGGLTWITIIYYSPGGFTLPANPFVGGGVLPPGNITPYTSWSTFTINLPPGAFSTSTMFQWIQESPTSGTCCDNWGIDNVQITPINCNPGGVYSWSNGAGNVSSQTVEIISDSTFTVTYTDGIDTCDSTFTINVVMPEVVNSGGTATYCVGDVVADVTVQASGQAPFTIDYTLDGVPNSVTDLGPVISLGNAPGTYVVTGLTDEGCYNSANDTETITINPLPNAGTDASVAYCSDGAAEDLFLLLGPSADAGGQWYDPTGTPTTMPHDPATMPAGQYMYVADALACTDTSYVDVSHIFVDITDITQTPVTCNGLSDGIIDVTGVNFVEYNIDNGTNYPITNPGTVGGFAAGTYTLTVTSPEGCTSSEQFTITEPAQLTLSTSMIDASCFSFCDGQGVVTPAGGVGPFTYNWQGQTGDQNGSVSGLCAGTYTAIVTDVFNCEAQIDYTITEPDNVIPMIVVDTAAGCFPHQVDFQNVTVSDLIETTYVDFGDGYIETFVGQQSFEHTYEKPGVYDVYVLITTTDGCQFEYMFEDLVEAYDNPIANFYVNPNNVSMLEATVGLVNASTDNMVLYEWSIPLGDPDTSNNENVNHIQYPLDAPGQYPVSLWITDANGCTDSITKYVSILNDLTFFAPNTFTPDGDEHNQNWEYHVNGIDVYDFNLKIFNRWGEIIWESNDVNVYWDGTYNGKIVEAGTYVWTMECGDIHNDSRYTFSGHVNVLK